MVCFSQIEAVILDVDGVMTDGSLNLDGYGENFKSFNAKDGVAFELFRRNSIRVGVISGKSSESLNYRCKQLGIDAVYSGCKLKVHALKNICTTFDIEPKNIAFIGDDVIDLPLFPLVGCAVPPSDAHALVKQKADLVLSSRGGDGAVREFVDMFLVEKNQCTLDELYKPLIEDLIALSEIEVQQ
ncbi:KdsC family phosphatase [Vibrio genomosp. F6]|uniref:3-deoxy-D-manno-octulosonate 8-phosphate phosphatase KdsC n=1 Tax=Vibrio genomosp. F6 str. FF-238 TaxID=1191298 RepID=A0A1E5D2K5_9VIBR|nr:HAD family hydrolase [Vibrio genomosp. F6]OEE77710.1 3-deoxy-manno-octulosonate-8-phosphatase [Vibrio genomosp. F6 str. FF-238]